MRENGYAINRGEWRESVHGIAAAISGGLARGTKCFPQTLTPAPGQIALTAEPGERSIQVQIGKMEHSVRHGCNELPNRSERTSVRQRSRHFRRMR